jgi:general stress protein 26
MIANYESEAQKFHDLLVKFETAMLVTRSSEGGLHGRPMAIAKVEDDCTVWFLSLHESGKVHEIEVEPHVGVTFQKDHNLYLSLTGQAELSRDRAKIAELWKESYKPWFPNGKDDPDIILISVEPEQGEFWNQQGGKKLQYLFETARAYATGTRAEVREGEMHAKVPLKESR